MFAEIIAGATVVTLVLGIASLYFNSRLGNFKAQIEALEKKLTKISERLAIVENERDSLKSDLDNCREKRILALEENRDLRRIMERCVNCKTAR